MFEKEALELRPEGKCYHGMILGSMFQRKEQKLHRTVRNPHLVQFEGQTVGQWTDLHAHGALPMKIQ